MEDSVAENKISYWKNKAERAEHEVEELTSLIDILYLYIEDIESGDVGDTSDYDIKCRTSEGKYWKTQYDHEHNRIHNLNRHCNELTKQLNAAKRDSNNRKGEEYPRVIKLG